MHTKKKRQQRIKSWGSTGDHVPAKAKKGRLLEGAEKAAAIKRLEDAEQAAVAKALRNGMVSRQVAVAAVRVERRIAQRLEGLDGSVSHSSRGLGNPLKESDQRNELAAQIAERRQENSERKLRQQEDRAAEMDSACERAWENRLDVRPIIRRELAQRVVDGLVYDDVLEIWFDG